MVKGRIQPNLTGLSFALDSFSLESANHSMPAWQVGPKGSGATGDIARIATFLDRFPRISLGRFPSPLTQATLENGCRFWIKDDGGCSEIYGGNKVRKLEFLLAAAQH